VESVQSNSAKRESKEESVGDHSRPRGSEHLALNWLFDTHRPRLVRLATSWTGNSADGEDIAQIALAKAIRAMGSFDAHQPRTEAAFTAWLNTIARNTALDWFRSRKRRPLQFCDSLDEQWATADGSASEQNEAAGLFEFAQEILSERHYCMLFWFYVDRLTTQEIAVRLETTSLAVRAGMFRARKALKKALARNQA
jgi:RNA polymerase sigma factor (sigma-70 family)